MDEPIDPVIPPDDVDAWTHEQWLAWLEATDIDTDDGTVRPPRRPTESAGGIVLGAAMLGMQQAMFGDLQKPQIVYEIEADGPDDGPRVDLDPDNPASSAVVIPKPNP